MFAFIILLMSSTGKIVNGSGVISEDKKIAAVQIKMQ